jgi:hypothetical protein
MKYVYPAIFSSEEGNILVSVPDLPELHTFGNSMADALFMAQDEPKGISAYCLIIVFSGKQSY